MENSKGGNLQEGASSIEKIADGDKTTRSEDKASMRPKSTTESRGNGYKIKQ